MVKKAAPSKGGNQRKTPKLKSGEKLAVSQEIKVEDLLHDFLRQELAPDANDGNNYYLGKVLSVLTSSQDNKGVFNIFEDSVSNMERFYSNYKITEKLDYKRLLVHIPELYSTNDFTPQDSLSNYTKFKINYYGRETIKENDILKIVFKNTNTFTDPEIIAIFKSDKNDNYQVEEEKLKNSYNALRECRILQLSGSQAPGLDLNSSYLASPVAGYYQLFDELNFILSNEGFKTFVREQGPNVNFTANEISQMTYTIYADDKVKAKIVWSKIQNKTFQDKDATPTIEERTDFEVLLRLTYSNSNILKKFASFVDQKLSKFKFFSDVGSPKDLPNSKLFYLDIIIDIQAFVGNNLNDASVDKYLEFSETRKNGPSPEPTPQTVQSSQTTQQTIQQNQTPESCENVQPAVADLYIPTDNPAKWNRSLFDSQFINYFLKPEIGGRLPLDYMPLRFSQNVRVSLVNDLLRSENLKISGEKIDKKESIVSYTFEGLQKKNSKFYSIPQKIQDKNQKKKLSIGIKSDYKDPQKTNFISKESLDFRIEKISDFLKNLKDLIVQNEQVPASDILILPLNVVRANTGGSPDTESRHYYGQAVDFVVYVRFPNLSDPSKSLVFQIPPIVIYFYCRKLAERQQFVDNSGNGIFIKESYNHFEFLLFPADEQNPKDAKSGLTEDERKNGRLWIVGSDDDALKNIDKLKNSEKHKILSDYLFKNYAKGNTANPVQKILRLL